MHDQDKDRNSRINYHTGTGFKLVGTERHCVRESKGNANREAEEGLNGKWYCIQRSADDILEFCTLRVDISEPCEWNNKRMWAHAHNGKCFDCGGIFFHVRTYGAG